MVFIHSQVVNRISCINGWPVPLMWGGIQRFARCCKESKKQMGGDQFEQQKQTVISYLFPFCFCLPFLSLGKSCWCTRQPCVHSNFAYMMWSHTFSKCPWPEQPNRDWKHWDMGRNQISPAFLCYNNWTVHASTIAVYINVPTGVHPLAQTATHSLPKLEQCNKQIFSLGNCPDRPLFNIAFPVVSKYTTHWCALSKSSTSKVPRNISEQRTSNISPFFPFKNFKFETSKNQESQLSSCHQTSQPNQPNSDVNRKQVMASSTYPP